MSKIPGSDKPIPVVLEPGRWTIQREGESPREAEERLMRGEDLETGLDPETVKRFDAANQAVPRFRRKS